MTKYFIEDQIYNNRIPRIIRQRDNHLVERYDPDAKAWIDDVEMLQIYTGGISVETISEENAHARISKASM